MTGRCWWDTGHKGKGGYIRSIPGQTLDEDVSIEDLAKGTPGFTPADLENLMNEAALWPLAGARKR